MWAGNTPRKVGLGCTREAAEMSLGVSRKQPWSMVHPLLLLVPAMTSLGDQLSPGSVCQIIPFSPSCFWSCVYNINKANRASTD